MVLIQSVKRSGLLILMALALWAAPAATQGGSFREATSDFSMSVGQTDAAATRGAAAVSIARSTPADPGQGDSMLPGDDDDDDDDDDAPPGAVRTASILTGPRAVAMSRRSLLASDGFNHHLLVVRLL